MPGNARERDIMKGDRSEQEIVAESAALQARIRELEAELASRQDAEAVLRAREAQYREVVESANSIILRMDTEGRIIFMNRFGLQFLGYSEAEILGENVVGTIVPETETSGRDLCRLLADIGCHPDYYAVNENENIRKSGERVWITWTNRGIYNFDGTAREVLCIGNDITQRKKAEEALRENEQKYRLLAENVTDVIWVMNSTLDEYTYVSPSVEQLTGHKPEEVIGRETLFHLAPGSREQVEVAMRNRIAVEAEGRGDDTIRRFELAYLHKNGTTVPVECTTRPLRNDDGSFAGLIGVTRDISERKRAERVRRELEVRLSRARKFESLGIMAGGIAHDFNNLLTTMLGNLEMALREMSSVAPDLPYIEAVEKAAHRAAEITRKMLDFSGQGRYTLQVADLNTLIRNAEKDLMAAVPSDTAFELHLYAGALPVSVDTTQMLSLLQHLIVNAVEALVPDQERVIRITTGKQDCNAEFLHENILGENCREGRYAFLAVSDTGEGLEEENRHRIFEPFFSTRFTGRGLGLSAVMGIVRGHRGLITVETQPGAGTEVTVYLPESREEKAQQAP
jgi:two-component system, cell cycle sensor histidine kinase and response regulator CckA